MNRMRSMDDSCNASNRRPFYAFLPWLIYGPNSWEKLLLFRCPFSLSEKVAAIWNVSIPLIWIQEWMWKWNREKMRTKRVWTVVVKSIFLNSLTGGKNRIKWFENEINLFFWVMCMKKNWKFVQKKRSLCKRKYTEERKQLHKKKGFKSLDIDFGHAECWCEKFSHKVTKCPQCVCNCFDIVYFWQTNCCANLIMWNFQQWHVQTTSSLDMNLKTSESNWK